jgi:hypothetical protein
MILARTVPAKLYVRIFSLVGEIYKVVAKVVFVAEICQRGNFTEAPGLTFQTYNKNKLTVILISVFDNHRYKMFH